MFALLARVEIIQQIVKGIIVIEEKLEDYHSDVILASKCNGSMFANHMGIKEVIAIPRFPIEN